MSTQSFWKCSLRSHLVTIQVKIKTLSLLEFTRSAARLAYMHENEEQMCTSELKVQQWYSCPWA